MTGKNLFEEANTLFLLALHYSYKYKKYIKEFKGQPQLSPLHFPIQTATEILCLRPQHQLKKLYFVG